MDVTVAAQTVTFTLHITDNISGVDVSSGNRISVGLRSPSGAQSAFGAVPFQSAVLLDASLSVPVQIPRYAEPGAWTISNIRLHDNAGNTTFINAPSLAAAGFPTTITISREFPSIPTRGSLPLYVDPITVRDLTWYVMADYARLSGCHRSPRLMIRCSTPS